MPHGPERPPSVPVSATFNADYDAWECSVLGAEGLRQGECRFFRRDGSLYLASHFDNGVQNGPFSMFHPNGDLAREGSYVDGEFDGEVVGYASSGPTTLPLRGCCVPPSARTLRSLYRHGQLVREVFYDADERALGFDGSPLPPRAANVPSHADFDDGTRRWIAREHENPLCHVDRYYDLDGHVVEELRYRGGHKREQQRYDGAGKSLEHVFFDEAGRRHGAYELRFEQEAGPYAESRAARVRGHYDRGQAVGPWQLVSAEDAPLAVAELGAYFDVADVADSPAFARVTPRSNFVELTRELVRAGRVREALCAAARASVREPDGASALAEKLALSVFPLRDELRAERAEALAADATASVGDALEHLLTGTDPAIALATLGSVLRGVPWASHDFLNASLELAPERTLTYLSRGLVRVELGDVRGAREDAERIAAESPAGAAFLRDSLHVYFPDYISLWPPAAELPPAADDAPDVGVAQPLEAVRRLMMVYATRSLAFTAALEALRPAGVTPKLSVPNLSSLLPHGPVALLSEHATIVDPQGSEEPVEVEIDETPRFEAGSARSIGTRLRADHAALAWLCWAVGLERIALPERIVPRPEFAAAVGQSLLRAFRTKDRLTTGGLVSLAQGIPSFVWEGLDVADMAPDFARALLEECREIRAMFLWIMFAENVSPFQSDLRED